jgi:hypothetical protein
MKHILQKSTLFIFILALGLAACKKDVPTPSKGAVRIGFTYVFGAAALPWAIQLPLLHPKTGDSLLFTEFAFYISNIQLKKADGTWWSEPESYHLICAHCNDKQDFLMQDVPVGDYVELRYTLGIDSLRNLSATQSGDLSPANGMYWDQEKGYIMIKAAGYSPQSETDSFVFHLGGFQGENSIVTNKTTGFGGVSLQVNSEKTPHLILQANPARLWHSSPSIAAQNSILQPGPEAKQMALDFYNNILFKEIR